MKFLPMIFLSICAVGALVADPVKEENPIKEVKSQVQEVKSQELALAKKENFTVMGIALRTTNENQKSLKEIPDFWKKFFQEKILEKIPNKKSNDIFAVYTDYEKDGYTLVIGCEVTTVDQKIPEGLVVKTVSSGNFATFKVKALEDVAPTWAKIWQMNFPRAFRQDYELYQMKDSKPVAIEIFVGVQ